MRYKGKKGKLWKIVSKYIRERDNYTCITCGKYATGQGMHAGHLIPTSIVGSNNKLNWDEKNIHAQCFKCNKNAGGWGEMYAYKFKAKYGEDELNKLRSRTHKVDPVEDWDELIEEYKKKLNDLQVSKM